MDHVLGPASEFRPGTRRIVEVERRSIGVFNVDGELYAVRNRCPHQGAPLCLGRLQGYWGAPAPHQREIANDTVILKCPWHGWEFDLADGRSVCSPDRWRVRTYEVSVSPERVETYDVTVEDSQVVLHL